MTEPKPTYTTHGGARPGAGRPTLDDTNATVRVAIVFTQWHLDQLDAMPGSNRSAKIRDLIERYIDGDDKPSE